MKRYFFKGAKVFFLISLVYIATMALDLHDDVLGLVATDVIARPFCEWDECTDVLYLIHVVTFPICFAIYGGLIGCGVGLLARRFHRGRVEPIGR